MEKFSVTAKLASPLVMGGGYFTLDALLAGLIFEKTGDVEIAHSTIPLPVLMDYSMQVLHSLNHGVKIKLLL